MMLKNTSLIVGVLFLSSVLQVQAQESSSSSSHATLPSSGAAQVSSAPVQLPSSAAHALDHSTVTASNEAPPIDSEASAEPVIEATVVPTVAPTPKPKVKRSAAPKNDLAFGPVQVKKVVNEGSKAEFSISFPAGSEFSSTNLTNPERTIFDVKGISLKGSRKVTLSDKDLVRTVRFGAHDDMVRVVFDLSGYELTSHKLGDEKSSGERSSVAITILGGGANSQQPNAHVISSEATAQTPAVGAAPSDAQALRIVEGNRVPEAKQVETAPTNTAPEASSETPSALSQPASETATAESQSLMGLTFDKIQLDSNSKSVASVVRVSLAKRPQFKLSRRDERSYRLIINDCTLGADQLTLPQFPPADFDGLTILRAERVGTSIEVIIGTERGVKLASVSRNNDILIRAILP